MRNLAGVPDKGPVLLVGNHMLIGLELRPIYEEFLREKKVIIRGMGHPVLFSKTTETSRKEISTIDTVSVYGALPVTPSNIYRLFSRRSFVLLYPGGAREALHRKVATLKVLLPVCKESHSSCELSIYTKSSNSLKHGDELACFMVIHVMLMVHRASLSFSFTSTYSGFLSE